jgi:diguanylate cyclase (GGDEF)-like protein
MTGTLVDQAKQLDARAQQTLEKIGSALVQPTSLLELLRADGSDPERISELISKDPALTARVLSVVNSAAYGLSTQITNVPRAVNLLGAGETRTIALAYGLRLIAEASGLPARHVETIWTASLTKACAARLFCEHVAPPHVDDGYAVGLIQDIALPMLMAVDTDFYEENMIHGGGEPDWLGAERRHFGIDHAGLGRMLLRQWGAPSGLTEPIALHHKTTMRLPKPSGESIAQAASLVAGVLPHFYEEPNETQRGWLTQVHARFLAGHFPSPDVYILTAVTNAREMAGKSEPLTDRQREQLIRRLIGEVSEQTVSTVASGHQMRRALASERNDLNTLRAKAFSDPLTKLLNRRGFTMLVERRLDEAFARGQSVCCMTFDIDDFKTINDGHGHEVGDRMLIGLARMLRRCARGDDLIGRLGGDEFVAFIPGLSSGHAHRMACHLAESIVGRELRVKDNLVLPLYLTIGAAYLETVTDITTLDALLAVADRALYQRKRLGKRGMQFTVADPNLIEQLQAEAQASARDE